MRERKEGDYDCYCDADGESEALGDAWVADFFVDVAHVDYGHGKECDCDTATVEPDVISNAFLWASLERFQGVKVSCDLPSHGLFELFHTPAHVCLSKIFNGTADAVVGKYEVGHRRR